ncbi:hypothetical protein [Tenacibaculum sp. 190524A05c]|uniref:Lipocalin-like protein n=1 Tax=Tenacibaculum platacis TaxID=3137852 RepID=A0ABP1EMW5_9FLAO
MKKLLLLFVSMSLFVSCSDDNGETLVDVDASEIVGKWDLIDFKSDGKTNTDAFGQSIESEYTSFGKDFDFEVDFADNPKTATGTGSYTTVITTKILGQSQTQEVPTASANGLESATWSVNGGILTITPTNSDTPNLASDAKIIEFDGETMKLKFDINETVEEEQQGIKVTIKVNATAYLTLKKQVSTAL